MATSIRPTAVKQRRPARVRSSSDPGPLESREEEEENGSVAAVYNSSKTWSSSGVVYVSLPVKLSSLLGAACFVWLCLDPVVLHGADRGSPSLLVPSFLQKDKQEDHLVPRPAVLVAQPEAIYLRHVVYNHDKALGETGFGMAPPGERNNSTSTTIVTKAEGRRNNKRVSVVVPPLSSKLRQSNIRDSEEYRGLDILVEKRDDDCQVKYAWQRNNRQNCNSMHEATDLTTRPTAVVPVLVASTTEKEQSTTTTTRAAAAAATTTMVVNRYQFLTHGYFRDVFMLLLDEQHFLQHHHNNKQQQPPPQNKIVFKPMRYEHDFEYRNFDRMRRDALTMDQLTGARHILNIYGNCGTSGLFEYADGGDIETAIWPNKVVVDNNSTAEEEYHREPSKVLTQMEKLHIGTCCVVYVHLYFQLSVHVNLCVYENKRRFFLLHCFYVGVYCRCDANGFIHSYTSCHGLGKSPQYGRGRKSVSRAH
jgi:hypothetical protein